MTDDKPALAQTPTQMAFKIQEIEIKLAELEKLVEKLEQNKNGKKTKTNNK